MQFFYNKYYYCDIFDSNTYRECDKRGERDECDE